MGCVEREEPVIYTFCKCSFYYLYDIFIVIWKSLVNDDDRPLGIITPLLRLKSKPKAIQTEMKADTAKI